MKRKTQNSGVVVKGDDVTGNIECYYGVLQDVIELQTYKGNHIVLFKYKWFNIYDPLN